MSQQAWFKNFLAELPKVIDFKEVATREKSVAAGNAAEKLAAFTEEKMKDGSMSYSEALLAVQAEHPDLAAEYQQEMTG